MIVSYDRYYYQVILSYSEESLRLSGTFLLYYDKSENGVYYPSIFNNDKSPFPISRYSYVLKDRIYSDNLTENSSQLTSTGTYNGENIYLLNDWVIDCKGLLLEKPIGGDIFPVINYNNKYASIFSGMIPKENDILTFQDNQVTLGKKFTVRIDIEKLLIIWEDNLIVSNLKDTES